MLHSNKHPPSPRAQTKSIKPINSFEVGTFGRRCQVILAVAYFYVHTWYVCRHSQHIQHNGIQRSILQLFALHGRVRCFIKTKIFRSIYNIAFFITLFVENNSMLTKVDFELRYFENNMIRNRMYFFLYLYLTTILYRPEWQSELQLNKN